MALDPKSSASASFATPAQEELYPNLELESILFLIIYFFQRLMKIKAEIPKMTGNPRIK